MPVLLRLLANPKLLGRFLRTKAGRRAALKYGTMVVNSKTVQDQINKFMNKNGRTMSGDARYDGYAKEFEKMQAQINALQEKVDAQRQDNEALQTATFTLGRRVIEMQRLYAQMQMELQRVHTAQMAAAARARTR